MAKKKSKPLKSTFNPLTYLKSGNARKLPIYECLFPTDWKELKKFPAIFSRKHVNGNLTFITVLVDLWCTGVKDVMFFVNEPEELYRTILQSYADKAFLEFEPVSYELVHNVIFESIAFAEEYGIAPHEDFRYAELILEEDTDDFPRIEVPLGEDGKAILFLNMEDDRSAYYERQILTFGQVGTYEIIEDEFDLNSDDDEEWEEDETRDKYSDHPIFWDESDWEEFYEEVNFEKLNKHLVIYLLTQLPNFRYEEMIEEPIFAPFDEIEIAKNQEKKEKYSKKERTYLNGIFKKLEDSDLEGTKGDQELLNSIEYGLEIYPQNKELYEHKWEYFIRSGNLSMALEIALRMKEKFPDYFFGLYAHALVLIEMGEVDSIPEAMNDFTKIQDFLPDRDKFHLIELLYFYSPWIYYYAKTKQLRAASFLFQFLQDHFVLFSYPLNTVVENALAEEAIKVVKPFLEKVKAREYDLIMGGE